MPKIKLTFPDGSIREFEKGAASLEIIKKVLPKLEKEAIAAKIDDKLIDLTAPLTAGGKFRILTFKDKEGKDVFRHSASHVMASAVKRVFPKAKLTIGPPVEDGFYYDFDFERPFTPEDMEKIEKEMKRIAEENAEFKRIELSSKQAKKKFKELGEDYKLELIRDLGDEQISVYQHGDFIDLCRGPHILSTGKIKAFKLMKLAGAYWRGSSENKQLQRIYGVAFPEKKELEDYLNLLEEAEKRDHRKLGRELQLFSIHDEGPGFPFFHPKGMIIWNELLNFWRIEHKKAGYVEIKTPLILNKQLWETSGHWTNYRENMYTLKIDNLDYAIKPMNCPGGFLWYKENVHSYKELPLRIAEVGQVHRHELSGVLSGLFRVRTFHQDDAHIFMTEKQIKDEILGVLNLADKFYKIFGLDYHLELSTRPAKSIGTDEQWEKATKGLKQALDSTGKKYKINEGEGAFYGPKIDMHLKDCLGRTWQCGTIQLDMSMPERFGLNYIGEDNSKHRPVMIHRVIYGSIERFFGILIEHFAGKFPLWLAPVQARIVTVADRFEPYAQKVKSELEKENFRVEIDSSAESIPKKVRDAQVEKIPLIITVGEKEEQSKTVAPRTLDGKVKFGMKVDELLSIMKKNRDEKKITIGV
jgi:threonyl-tRNA synthetase